MGLRLASGGQSPNNREHSDLPQPESDQNTYTLGSIGNHNIAIACLPDGEIGNNPAATVATRMTSTFPSIKFWLMVGIGGGVPPKVRLGDIVVGSPLYNYPGVVQWDLGLAQREGFRQIGALNKAPEVLRTAIQKLKAQHILHGSDQAILSTLEGCRLKYPTFARSEHLEDILFRTDYDHVGERVQDVEDRNEEKDNDDYGASNDAEEDEGEENGLLNCRYCDRAKVVKRKPRKTKINIHYGLIASGNSVMKDPKRRDEIDQRFEGLALCFEMEAAGISNSHPCLVIRGICDYSDTHKNYSWQEYAAGVAAAFAKKLLGVVAPIQVNLMQPAAEVLINKVNDVHTFARLPFRAYHFIVVANFSGENNYGAQVANFSGQFLNNIYLPAERIETPPQPSFNSPFPPDHHFVKREDLLDQIYKGCSVKASRTVLVGLGGIGKSQLAIEYGFHIREQSPETWVFWIHASDIARFDQSLKDVADNIKLPGRNDKDADIPKMVHDWLRKEHKRKWVVILDNVDDAGFLFDFHRDSELERENSHGRRLIDYLPYNQSGSMLITSRYRTEARRLVDESDVITIEPMDEPHAIQLLQNRLGEVSDAKEVSEATLDFIPLAVVQAASYIRRRGPLCSIKRYLELFSYNDAKKTSLLNHDKGHLRRDRDAENSVILTWQISFDHIRQARPSAADLLSLMCFFNRQGIPAALLHRRDQATSQIDGNKLCFSDDEGEMSDLEPDDEFEEDILTLIEYAFVAVVDVTTFGMHSLVQFTTQQWLNVHEQFEKWSDQFVENLHAKFPSCEYENWRICQQLYPHAKSAVLRRPQAETLLLKWASLLSKAAEYAFNRGYSLEAETLCLEATRTMENVLGQEVEQRLYAMELLNNIYGAQARWKEAEELEIKIVEATKEQLGVEDPKTIRSMNNLAAICRSQGRYEEAEKLLTEVVETKKKVLQAENSDPLADIGMLVYIDNLSSIYANQGRLEEAEELSSQVLEARKKVLTAEHPITLLSMNNLTVIYTQQGRWKESEKLLVHALEIGEVYQANHPDLWRTQAHLAFYYFKQGWWKEAEELYVQVMEVYKKKLGEKHPETLKSMVNLASTYEKQEQWKEAEELKAQVADIQKSVEEKPKEKPEEKHPVTLTRSTSPQEIEIGDEERKPKKPKYQA